MTSSRAVSPSPIDWHRISAADPENWYIAAVLNVASQPVVIHADLGADHVLVHERRVSGVIDFSDVSVGDADYDFASLFIDVGEEFTMNVARRYGHSNLDLLLAKLEYFEAADCLDTIVNGEGFALPGQREAAWRRLRRCLYSKPGRLSHQEPVILR